MPARVLVRYWAAARSAAGVPEEYLEGATLGEILAAARARHGAELDRVLGRCSFLVDEVRATATTPLSEGAVVEVLPPFAGGAPAAAVPLAARDWRAGPLCLVLAAVTVVAAVSGPVLLAGAVILVQLLFVGSWTAGARGGALLAGSAGVAAAVLLALGLEVPVLAPVTWVLGAAVVGAFLAQLARRDGRRHVVVGLSAALTGAILAVLGALLVALAELRAGLPALAAGLAGVVVATMAASAGLRPALAPGALAAVAVAGAASAAALGSLLDTPDLDALAAVVLAVVAAVAALPAATLARAGTDPGSRMGIAAALPVLLCGPAAYVTARLLGV